MKVPLPHQCGDCRGVKSAAGVNHINEVNIQCLPDHLPEFIEANLAKLEPAIAAYQRITLRPESSDFAHQEGQSPIVTSRAEVG